MWSRDRKATEAGRLRKPRTARRPGWDYRVRALNDHSAQSDPAGTVIVVGAGVAGLHAAWRLHTAGADVVVLEAGDRVGGRTWSAVLEDGTIVERGGEFIAPADWCLRELCDELGLELVPHGFSFDLRTVPGQDPPTEEDVAAVAADAHAQAIAHDGDVSAEVVLPPLARRSATQASIIRRLETSLTVPLADVSARRLFAGAKEGYDPAVRVRAGNDAIARELAARLGDRVRLRSPVVAVDHDARRATVHVEDGSSLPAMAVVLAVPLPCLLGLDLRPSLPSTVVTAAGRLRFGDAAKLHIPLTGPAAPGGVASPAGLWWCWVSRAADSERGAPVLSAFAGGLAAVQAVGADRGAAQWCAEALKLRPDVEADGEPLVTHWGASRWASGSYTAPAVGLTVADDAAWAAPCGVLVFAGEQTAGADAGTMNGAALSGARAARTAVKLIQANPQVDPSTSQS
jgi:monoamine oxidase